MSTGHEAAADAKRAAREILEGGKVGRLGVDRVKSSLASLAENGDIDAQNLIGAIKLEIDHDPAGARRWFEMAASRGDSVGQRSLGHLYANGLGVKVDILKAANLFREASAGGDYHAMYNFAMVNIKAQGAYCDFEETLSLLERAVNGGVVEASAKLGDLLAAVDRDSEALEWYVKAATNGHLGAMNAAACWFRDGTAGAPDPVQSVRWFLAMLNYGNGDGVHEAIAVARNMSAEQIREAARLADRVADGESLISTIS